MNLKRFSILSLFSVILLNHPTYSQHSLNASLGSAHAQIGICGELPLERKRRDCLKSTDLKQCLNQDRVNPQYVSTENEEKNFLCLNTSSTSGSRLIEEMIRSTDNVCLSENVNDFYRDIIEHPEFREISQQFEENLGVPLKLNYAIDTLNSVASIQLDLKEYRSPGTQEEDVTLTVTPFAAQSPCQKLNPKGIFKRVSQELARLTIKISTEEENLYGQKDEEKRVFDANRFITTETVQEEENVQREMASER